MLSDIDWVPWVVGDAGVLARVQDELGLGGPLANFAGLLHMTMHSLTKSAIFFSVGQIAQVKKTQTIV